MGDCVELMAPMPENSVDAIVCCEIARWRIAWQVKELERTEPLFSNTKGGT